MEETTDHQNLRTRIREIQEDTTKTPAEKMQCIQRLMAREPTPPAELNNCSTECTHYLVKKCSRMTFSCCNNLVDPCHRCHLARKKCTKPEISAITCNLCDHIQPPSNQCIECSIEFAPHFCPKCNLWTDAHIRHCDDCGLCRVLPTPDSELFHCHTCKTCFDAATRDYHVCARVEFRDASCPMCLEQIHDSQRETTITKCGHIIHMDCFYDYVDRDNYRCPTCRKSLYDMSMLWRSMRAAIALQPIPRGFFPVNVGDTVESRHGMFYVANKYRCQMNPRLVLCEGYFPHWRFPDGRPPQYAGTAILRETELCNKRVKEIYCYDCEERSNAEFHFLGLECGICGGFNTSA